MEKCFFNPFCIWRYAHEESLVDTRLEMIVLLTLRLSDVVCTSYVFLDQGFRNPGVNKQDICVTFCFSTYFEQ